MVKYLGIDPKTRKEKVSRKALLPRPPREDKKTNYFLIYKKTSIQNFESGFLFLVDFRKICNWVKGL